VARRGHDGGERWRGQIYERRMLGSDRRLVETKEGSAEAGGGVEGSRRGCWRLDLVTATLKGGRGGAGERISSEVFDEAVI